MFNRIFDAEFVAMASLPHLPAREPTGLALLVAMFKTTALDRGVTVYHLLNNARTRETHAYSA